MISYGRIGVIPEGPDHRPDSRAYSSQSMLISSLMIIKFNKPIGIDQVPEIAFFKISTA